MPVLMANEPSIAPVLEKAQQEPQRPWFFTGVTAPLATQSMSSASGACSLPRRAFSRRGGSRFSGAIVREWMKSSAVISEYALWPSWYDRPRALCSEMISELAMKMENACFSSAGVEYFFEYSFFHCPKASIDSLVEYSAFAPPAKTERAIAAFMPLGGTR